MSLSALEFQDGDLLTPGVRISTATGELAPIAPITPTAVDPADGLLYVLDFSGFNNAGQLKRKVWSFSPTTGKQTLLATTDIPVNFLFGRNIIAKGTGDEIYIMNGTSTTTVLGLLAIDVNTGAQRAITNPGLGFATLTDLVVTDAGLLVVPAATGVLLMDTNGVTLASPGGTYKISGLTRTAGGGLVGVAPNNSLGAPELDIVAIDDETGAMTLMGSVVGFGKPNGMARIAEGKDGNLIVLSVRSSDVKFCSIDPATFEVTDLVLPEGVDIISNSDLEVDPAGNILLRGQDRRPGALNLDVLFCIDPATAETKIALGPASILAGTMGQHPAAGFRGDVFFTNVDDRVLRLDLRNGGVTPVTTGATAGAVIRKAMSVAVSGDDIYVIERESTSLQDDAHLVHVDARTGVQTHLTNLGPRLVARGGMVFDDATGELYFTGYSLVVNGSAVMRVLPETDAVWEVISEGGKLTDLGGIQIDGNGDLIVANLTGVTGVTGVYRIDRNSGVQTVVSESPLFTRITDVVVEDNGDIVAADFTDSIVYRIASSDGEVSVLASGGSIDAETELRDSLVFLLKASTSGLPPIPLTLSSSVTAQGIRLEWDQDGNTWSLESTTQLNPAAWIATGVAPVDENGQWRVELPVETGDRFFRLSEGGQ